MNAPKTPCPVCAHDPVDPAGAFDRLLEARVVARLERDAWRWRFRLLALETVMMAGLVLAAGLALHQPTLLVLRAALMVGASCFASGMMLLGLSTGTGRLLSRIRARSSS